MSPLNINRNLEISVANSIVSFVLDTCLVEHGQASSFPWLWSWVFCFGIFWNYGRYVVGLGYVTHFLVIHVWKLWNIWISIISLQMILRRCQMLFFHTSVMKRCCRNPNMTHEEGGVMHYFGEPHSRCLLINLKCIIISDGDNHLSFSCVLLDCIHVAIIRFRGTKT